MGFHDLFCCSGGGDYESGDVAEMEEHQGSVLICKGAKRAVWESPELMEVSDNGKLGWRRRKVDFLGSLSIEFKEEEEDERSGKEEERE